MKHNTISTYRRSPDVTIRWATPDDATRLKDLAELDEAPLPAAPLLLGLVDGELWVAVSAGTGRVISDPFRPAAEVALLVLERRRQLTVSQPGRVRGVFARLRGPSPAGAFSAEVHRA